MDKEWTKHPRFSKEYIDGLESFLDFVYTKGRPQGLQILCPCASCKNCCWATRDVVYDHLIATSFLPSYKVWVHHGEDIPSPPRNGNDMEDDEDLHDDMDGLLYDTFINVVDAKRGKEGPNDEAKKLYNLIKEGNQELYPGCERFSSLSFVIRLYLLKCLHGWSNTLFTELLNYLKRSGLA